MLCQVCRSSAAVVLVYAFLASPVAAQCLPNTSPNDWEPDDNAIQSCLNQGGETRLERGFPGYVIASGLEIVADGTTLTAVGPDKAILIAANGLQNPMLLARSSRSNYTVYELIFDGNKTGRDPSICGQGIRPANLTLFGTAFTAPHIDSINALCGTGFAVQGRDFNIYSVYAADNGFSVDEPGPDERWADGMTVLACIGGSIRESTFQNNTDFDLLVGSGRNCVIDNITISHTTKFAFGGFNVGFFANDFGTPGDHFGATYSNMNISSSFNMLEFGLSVGSHPFIPPGNPLVTLSNAGGVSGNTISGTQINLSIDGISDGAVVNNTLTNPQGNRTNFNGCAFNGNYTAGHFGGVVQDGFTRIFFDHGQCTFW